MGRHRIRGDDGSSSGSVALGVSSGRISPHRNITRRSFSHGPQKPPQPARKADILMEAGRLAAEYLVSKGLLPPDSLPGKWHRGAHQEFNNRSRESSMPPPESRTSALARLGNAAPDFSHGRRRFYDEYDRPGFRKHGSGKRKVEYYDRHHGSSWGDWGRPRGRNGRWMERVQGYSDNAEGDDDFNPGFQRKWRGGFREVGSSLPRAAADELPSRSEVTGESGSEQYYEVTNDKGSSSSSRKDRHPEADSGVLNSEVGEEVKSHASNDLMKRTPLRKNLDMQPGGVEDGPVDEHDKDLLKLSSFTKVPTRRRSSLAHRSPKVDRDPKTEASNTFEIASAGVSKLVESSSSDSHENQTNSLKCQALDSSSIPSVQPMEESVNPRHESCQNPQGMGTCVMVIDVGEEHTLAQHVDKREEIKSERESSPSRASHSQLHDSKAPQSSPFIEKLSVDEEMAEAVDHEKPISDAVFPNCESLSIIKIDKEKQPASFKICDLNLMGSPEVTRIPDDPFLDHHPTSLTLEIKKKLSIDFGLLTGNKTDHADDCRRLSGDGKVVPVINLEDDSPVEDNVCGSSKPKSEAIYSSLENVLNHTPHKDDLPRIQDGYSLEISELLGSNISRCPSVQADLNSLQTGMSIQSAEGFPGDDDPIYVSLGELPIGFMDVDVWDQPPQDYGKFF